MSKTLLLEKYIKKAVRKALQEQEEQQVKAEKAIYFIHRFPGLKKTLVELMSPVFGRYIADINLVSPKPTTFNVALINGQNFSISYLGKGNFNVKIAGKRYNPSNIGESQRASQAITDLLELNYAAKETAEEISSKRDFDIKSDLEVGGEIPSGNLSPAELNSVPTSPQQTPNSEEPLPPEETPEELPV
jgi:hypothetical protein